MIDLHAHIVVPGVEGRVPGYGPHATRTEGGLPCFRIGTYELRGVDYHGTPFVDIDLRLQAMQAAGIDLQIVSPNPLTYFQHIDAKAAANYCRWHNTEVAAIVSGYPKLGGFAQVPLQSPELAAAELERAVADGLIGAYIGTDHRLDTPEMDTFWSAVTELDVPVMIHPAPHGIDGPPADPRLDEWGLDLTLGFTIDETFAVAQLVFGGVLDRHRNLDVCISHGGGATAWLLERIERAAGARPGIPDSLREPGAVRAALGRLWWDAHVGGPAALRFLCDQLGADRVVPGTNLSGWDADTIAPDHLGADFDANARRLLRLT